MEVLQPEIGVPWLSRARAKRGGEKPHQNRDSIISSPSRAGELGQGRGTAPPGTVTAPTELSSVPQLQKPHSVVCQFPFSRLLLNTELPKPGSGLL